MNIKNEQNLLNGLLIYFHALFFLNTLFLLYI